MTSGGGTITISMTRTWNEQDPVDVRSDSCCQRRNQALTRKADSALSEVTRNTCRDYAFGAYLAWEAVTRTCLTEQRFRREASWQPGRVPGFRTRMIRPESVTIDRRSCNAQASETHWSRRAIMAYTRKASFACSRPALTQCNVTGSRLKRANDDGTGNSLLSAV